MDAIDTTLRLRVKYFPDGGKDVKHPNLGYLFRAHEAERIIGKYHLDNGAGFEDISSILQYEDTRNFGLAAHHADFVDVIIIRGRGTDSKKVANRYDFTNRKISNFIV